MKKWLLLAVALGILLAAIGVIAGGYEQSTSNYSWHWQYGTWHEGSFYSVKTDQLVGDSPCNADYRGVWRLWPLNVENVDGIRMRIFKTNTTPYSYIRGYYWDHNGSPPGWQMSSLPVRWPSGNGLIYYFEETDGFENQDLCDGEGLVFTICYQYEANGPILERQYRNR